jgi:hypothetical protein
MSRANRKNFTEEKAEKLAKLVDMLDLADLADRYTEPVSPRMEPQILCGRKRYYGCTKLSDSRDGYVQCLADLKRGIACSKNVVRHV